jgi:uncharacterized protein (TIGR02757 family)
MKKSEIRDFLELHYLRYKHECSSVDPVWSLRRFGNEKDIEAAAFITACYCYGRVEVFGKFLDNIFTKTGNNIHDFILNYTPKKDRAILKGAKYRFNSEQDFEKLILVMQRCFSEAGSIKNLFLKNYNKSDITILNALVPFTEYFNRGIDSDDTFRYLIPLASSGSACKRLNLFLRWMVRNDEIDIGIWSDRISKSKLIMPVDTHIYRISREMKFVTRATADMKFALELTDFLKQFDEDDPVRYDFALCHIGIDNLRK